MPAEEPIEAPRSSSIAPSIFNDSMGPVMRGPSSSHCAAAHKGQGTDMGLYSGILGYDVDDNRLQHFEKGIAEAGIHVEVQYLNYGATHPNNYKLSIANASESLIVSRMTLYTTAMMDVKSSMGVIVAAPTAGSCGTVPGALFGAA
jgi:L-serine deaminase